MGTAPHGSVPELGVGLRWGVGLEVWDHVIKFNSYFSEEKKLINNKKETPQKQGSCNFAALSPNNEWASVKFV